MSKRVLPPGPARRLPGQDLMEFRKDAIGLFRRLAHDYGDITYVKMGVQPTYLLNHPDYVKDVLVANARCFAKGRGLERAKRLVGQGLLTSEGEFHRRQRRLMQPAFHRKRINAYAETMVECGAQMRERWRAGETRDIFREMMHLTLAIVGKTLFGADVESEADEIDGALTEAMALFQLLMLPGAELLEKLPLPAVRRFRQAKARLDATIYRMIAAHRQSGEDSGDLLSMLLMAQDEEAHCEQMTDAQVRDEAMTIFLAGHETTANALTWTWYLLSQNPEAEAKLHAEVDTVLAGRVPTMDDLPCLPYTRMVLAESLRLYPPGWIIGRRALEEYEVAGYVIPKGAIVVLAQVVTHRDPRWFPDPDTFDPARWTPEAEAARPKFSYFPFGGGPRICIGEQFAWMEGILLLATLAQRWRLRLVPGHPIATQPIITLRPKYGMKMVLEKRG